MALLVEAVHSWILLASIQCVSNNAALVLDLVLQVKKPFLGIDIGVRSFRFLSEREIAELTAFKERLPVPLGSLETLLAGLNELGHLVGCLRLVFLRDQGSLEDSKVRTFVLLSLGQINDILGVTFVDHRLDDLGGCLNAVGLGTGSSC